MGASILRSQSSETIELPIEVISLLKAQAKADRKPVAELILDWLEEKADIRDAEKAIKKINSGQSKKVPAKEVYARLGI